MLAMLKELTLSLLVIFIGLPRLFLITFWIAAIVGLRVLAAPLP
jgi:hypothetical protein